MNKKMHVIPAIILLLTLLLIALPGQSEIVRVLDCTLDLPAMAQGEKQDGESDVFGDDFTIMYSAKNKFDGSEKIFDDGYYGTQRLNFGGKTQPGKGMINAVRFTAESSATVKFWWVSGGDDRQFALYDEAGAILQETKVHSVKNNLYISSFDIDAGTYYLGVPQGSNYLFKLEVRMLEAGEVLIPRTDWAEVSAPLILDAQDTKDGEIEVTVSAVVGRSGADDVTVTMLDSEGNVLATRRSLAEKDIHTLIFEPISSGTYTFTAAVNRENEEEKQGDGKFSAGFILPLSAPHITGIHSAGGGKLRLVWSSVPESTRYEVFCENESIGLTADTFFISPALTIGDKHSFTVRALRDNETGPVSEAASAIAVEEEQRLWTFSVFGPSTNEKDNGVIGSLNEDGFVTVYSENGKGKIQPHADDGVAFYYTAIPANQNFTLRAHVHVDSWQYSNGQEGFGLMAMDSVPETGADSHLTNQYMALATKVEYYWQNGKPSESGIKYTMRLGLGALSKIGYEPGSRSPVLGYMWPLEYSAARHPIEGVSNYNAIGNNANPDVLDKTASTVAELTDLILEIEKNNTGYSITYYNTDGSVIGQWKDYDPQALNKMDAEYVYAGFFAARNARATFSDVSLSVTDPQDGAAAEERPITYITPSVSVTSAQTSGKADYTVTFVANCPGTARIRIDGETVAEGVPAQMLTRSDCTVTLPNHGELLLEVVFTPDVSMLTDPYTRLSSDRAVYAEQLVTYTTAYAALDTLYVTPAGTPSGRGTKDSPLNLTTAAIYARPGQTILLSEGVYNFVSPLRIPQGVDGTAEAPIRLIADPEAASRPVLDFKQQGAGIIHGGDYWHFEGFDVCNTQNNQKGFQVSGHYNTLKDICAYHNGNTGIQISRYAGSDPAWDWPHDNLILNCTSYGNADAGYEDADGFAAKLTCGEGNVFDGCIAYRNADDGFDLYAKVETGPIGQVIIRNSAAYENGYLEDGTAGGNGNGFKLGGSNIPGGHVLENSYAFFNKAKGIDANSCPDVQVKDCVSYNNLRYNVAFYTNQEQDTAYQAQGVISFKDAAIPGGDPSEEDELKPRGDQDLSAIYNDTCYYWNGAACTNAGGDAITADDFVSLTFCGVTRNEDGSIDLQGFLQLK